MISIETLYDRSALALAAYATLTSGPTSDPQKLAALEAAGMAAKQANEFARRYSTVVTQFNDTVTSFSATVFRDADGNLALAIRGTVEAGDFAPTDAHIFTYEAGYDQIVALFNWWRRVTTLAGTLVPQFAVREYIGTPLTNAVPLYPVGTLGAGYLVPVPSALSTGELEVALLGDSDGRLEVAGHSLGGHLGLAFEALIDDDVALGGDLAYQYGNRNALTGIGLTAALDALSSANFGAQAQALRPFSGLQEGLVKLS